jgi:hypothetical protein
MKIFVPGRVCLFGEHSDWAGGYRRINAEIEKGYTLLAGTNIFIRPPKLEFQGLTLKFQFCRFGV